MEAVKRLLKLLSPDIGFIDPTPSDHVMLGKALNKALYNYMHGIELDRDVREWFAEFMDLNSSTSMRIPKPRVARNFVEKALSSLQSTIKKPRRFKNRTGFI